MLNKLVTLHPDDNVLICCQALEKSEVIEIAETQITVQVSIDVGHKVAKQNIKTGEKILRYGVPIGSATADINIGEHVHIHNMKSDYIPSHTRQSRVGE